MVLKRKLGIVDLTKEKVTIKDVPESLRRAYLGGRGMNMHYLLKMLPEGIDPLSPDNVLIFGTGFLTGTSSPSSSRFSVSAKSPESMILGDANCGGFFGPELRYAGFDRLILLGKASRPSFIYVNDGVIQIRDAKDHWGLDTNDAQKSIRQEVGDCETVVCGVAGEKMVRFANVRTGVKNAAGRGGMGAVMGSKNVKAIAATGTIGLKIAHPEKMLEYVLELKDYLMSSKITPILGSMGTPLLYEVSNAIGAIRTKNSQLNQWDDSLNASEIHKYVNKMVACADCFVHCRHRNKLNGEGPEYTTIGLLGANVGLSDTAKVIELGNIANDLGLDVSSAGTILAWAFELYEKGIITEEMTGEPLGFGDYELTKSLLYKISRREGFGNTLAESTQAAELFGPKARDYLIAVKNLPQSDPHDVRYLKAFALGIATASRGADHLRSRPTLEIFLKLPLEVKEKIYGKGIVVDPTAYEGKEKTVYFSENIFATIDCLGLCKFICHGFNSPHFLKYEHFSKLIKYASDIDMSQTELLEVGKRVVDTERLINIREGVTRKDDTLPKRYFDDPMPLGVSKGHHIDRQKFDEMLTKFYRLRGWNDEGMVPEDRKVELEAIQ